MRSNSIWSNSVDLKLLFSFRLDHNPGFLVLSQGHWSEDENLFDHRIWSEGCTPKGEGRGLKIPKFCVSLIFSKHFGHLLHLCLQPRLQTRTLIITLSMYTYFMEALKKSCVVVVLKLNPSGSGIRWGVKFISLLVCTENSSGGERFIIQTVQIRIARTVLGWIRQHVLYYVMCTCA